MKKFQESASRHSGFTMIELMVVIAIIAILAMMTIPSYYYRVVREQIESITPLTTVAETPIAASWALAQTMPANNEAAGLPSADKIVGNYVTSVQVVNGAVNVTFGNRAISSIKGKILSFRPAVVMDSPVVPITWVCGNAPAPNKMTIVGANQTNIPPALLPLNCK